MVLEDEKWSCWLFDTIVVPTFENKFGWFFVDVVGSDNKERLWKLVNDFGEPES